MDALSSGNSDTFVRTVGAAALSSFFTVGRLVLRVFRHFCPCLDWTVGVAALSSFLTVRRLVLRVFGHFCPCLDWTLDVAALSSFLTVGRLSSGYLDTFVLAWTVGAAVWSSFFSWTPCPQGIRTLLSLSGLDSWSGGFVLDFDSGTPCPQGIRTLLSLS